MALKLIIPSIAEKLDPTVERRGVYVEEWIEALPYANPGVLANNLLETVAKLNRNPVKPAVRLGLMELYAKPYEYLLDLQRKHGASRTVAAFEKHRADSDAARRVAVEMAYGYKTVLAQSVGRKSLFGKNKEVITAVQRAMLFLSFSLLHSYDEYLPTPPHLWSEMWELYEYANRTAIIDEDPGAEALGPAFSGTIANNYKRILLTSLVDPYHLREGDIWQIYALLGDWADIAGLGPMKTGGKPAGLFLVDAGSDQRPIGYHAGGTGVTERCLLLDATPVIEQLQSSIKTAPESSTERQQLGRVLRSLGLPPKRHSPRESTRGVVNLTSGLTSLHHFLNNSSTTAPAPAATPAETDTDDGIEIGDTSDASTALRPTYSEEHWDIVNKGPGGVGILKNERPQVAVGVGELIGLVFEPGDDLATGWSIGVVRWLNVADVGAYHAGVQLLSRSAEAVQIQSEAEVASAVSHPTLALPRLGGDKSSTLITPKGCYQKDAVYMVRTGSNTISIRASALVESAETYERFTYQIAG